VKGVLDEVNFLQGVAENVEKTRRKIIGNVSVQTFITLRWLGLIVNCPSATKTPNRLLID